MTLEAQIQSFVDKINNKLKDEAVKSEVKDIKKSLCIDLGEEKYSMRLENAEVLDYKAEGIDGADITLIATPENMEKLLNGDLKPMRAYLTKKVVIKGKIDDLMFLKKFL